MDNKIPNRIKEIREARGISQSDLAKQTGLSASAICQFESGERNPSLDTLAKISKALDTSVNELIKKSQENETLDAKTQLLFRDLKELSANDKKMVADIVRSLKAKK